MKRPIQGLLLGAGLVVFDGLLIALALAWGPHQHICKIAFPMVIGCAIGTFQVLASGTIAASSALFAGWFVWSAVRAHIDAEAEREMADRTEAARALRGEIDNLARAVGPIWKNLDSQNEWSNPKQSQTKLPTASFGMDQITEPMRLNRLRKMAKVLGWQRRRLYEDVLVRLERLKRINKVDDFDVYAALVEIRALGHALLVAQPETAEHFGELFRGSTDATTVTEAINRQNAPDDDDSLPFARVAIAVQLAKSG